MQKALWLEVDLPIVQINAIVAAPDAENDAKELKKRTKENKEAYSKLAAKYSQCNPKIKKASDACYVCKYCGKELDSSKALGGHISKKHR